MDGRGVAGWEVGRWVGGWEVGIPLVEWSFQISVSCFPNMFIPYARVLRIDRTDLEHFRLFQ